MSILRNICLDDGRRFYLCDDPSRDDDRTVEDHACRVRLGIDHNLYVTNANGKHLTHIRSAAGGISWTMDYQGQTHALGPNLRGYRWDDLMDAEAAAAKIILPTLD